MHIYQHIEAVRENVILYFHGGGYVFGVPEQVDDLMFKMTRDLRATIVSVDYRLAPQYPFPIPILDGFDALKWIMSDGEQELGISSERITLFGGSAGAHLAAAVVQMTVDNKINNIKHQFLLYPVITNRMDSPSMVEFSDSPLWNTFYADAAWIHFYGEDYKTKSDRYADLLNFDAFEELPQTTIVACELDPLRDEAIAYTQELYRAGVPTELWVVPGAVHVFDLFACPLSDKFYDFLIDRMTT
ncbi:alpha/beta hydrolase [Myroides injenensis]|uniref:alpha/beta hydrolase n=1 Tax=Myroides injenensis TaxID=1183151 RepID=UPI0002893222|nr:alpha/beta hydrolase [Myroides injenensis]